MSKYDEIQKAVSEMTPTNIKGKPYIEVNQRIKAFRKCYPDGSIVTKIVKLENGMCLFKCSVYDSGRLIAVGHAYEKEGSTFINKTSYIENAETSAVGRALGVLGIGIDTSVASAIEVQNAMANQHDLPKEELEKMDRPISKEQAKVLVQFAKAKGWSGTDAEVSKKICDHFHVEKLSEVTESQRALFVKGI